LHIAVAPLLINNKTFMSRKIYSMLLVVCIVLLSSCLDTEEKIVINKDNSGVYSLTMDMGRMIKMMKEMGKDKEGEKKKMEKKDSTIYFKSFVDTSTKLTPEEKEMLKEGSLHVAVNEFANEMKFVIDLPFKKIQDLAYLRENYMKALDKINIKDQLNNKEKKEGEENMEHPPSDMATGSNSILPAQNSYTFMAAPGKLSNKFTDKKSFEEQVNNDSTLQMMKGLTAMMGEMTYKTTIILPKPVKHYKGNNASVSADKKTVTFKNSLTGLFKKPESFEFELDY
jgi:hypothetical protein